jgi:hypothetical protein
VTTSVAVATRHVMGGVTGAVVAVVTSCVLLWRLDDNCSHLEVVLG